MGPLSPRHIIDMAEAESQRNLRPASPHCAPLGPPHYSRSNWASPSLGSPTPPLLPLRSPASLPLCFPASLSRFALASPLRGVGRAAVRRLRPSWDCWHPECMQLQTTTTEPRSGWTERARARRISFKPHAGRALVAAASGTEGRAIDAGERTVPLERGELPVVRMPRPAQTKLTCGWDSSKGGAAGRRATNCSGYSRRPGEFSRRCSLLCSHKS